MPEFLCVRMVLAISQIPCEGGGELCGVGEDLDCLRNARKSDGAELIGRGWGVGGGVEEDGRLAASVSRGGWTPAGESPEEKNGNTSALPSPTRRIRKSRWTRWGVSQDREVDSGTGRGALSRLLSHSSRGDREIPTCDRSPISFCSDERRSDGSRRLSAGRKRSTGAITRPAKTALFKGGRPHLAPPRPREKHLR